MSMDSLSGYFETTSAKVSGLCTGTVILGAFITATVYLGIYSYNNPDPEKCWVIKGVEIPQITRSDAIETANNLGIQVPNGYPVNIQKLFIAWFMWGFWSHIALIILCVLGAMVKYILKETSMMTGGALGMLYLLNWFIWVVVGSFWRFGQSGAIAAGVKLERDPGVTDEEWDAQIEAAAFSNGYQINSGVFLKAYLIIAWVLISLCVVGSLCMGALLALKSWLHDKKEEDEDGEKKSRSERKRSDKSDNERTDRKRSDRGDRDDRKRSDRGDRESRRDRDKK